MAQVYADEDDYIDWAGSAPADIGRVLVAASRRIDQLLLCAHYLVDGDGYPTAAAVVLALREATCVQAQYQIATGDRYGTGQAGTRQVQLGKLSISRDSGAGGGGGGGSGRYSEDARAVLALAGLIPSGPMVP